MKSGGVLAVLCTALALGACSEVGTQKEDPFATLVQRGDGCGFEGQPPCELEEVVVEACTGGNCDDDDDEPECDPYMDPNCGGDPCLYDPTAPGCPGDICTMDPSWPGCSPDPCDYDPTAPECGGGPGEDPPPDEDDDDDKDPCETGNAMVDSAAVQAGFKSLWEKSNFMKNGQVQPESERRERLGWVIKNADGSYSFQEETSPTLTFKPCGIDGASALAPPANAVAWVHTHPYSILENQTKCEGVANNIYGTGPSDADRAQSAAWNLPGIVIDNNFVSRFTKENVAANIDVRCGY
ncbi:hypothetical protein [Pyxidicoccus sp. MSG2]|uniref:hypothetical protein n=1 Tax=Pyxidicoccus sp. MSG2 TaxID=2996790 RepID=UPI00227028F3|nr:hypothetical protein [Pyxidicoccus sp. MSG2]MCY1019672.1 hypothetical protein [Pyxidicoccus sp. MSG2]